MHLHHAVGESLVGRQKEGLILPNLGDRVLIHPTLIQDINGSDAFDDFEEATFPFLAVFATIEEDLGFSAYLSSVDAEFCYFLGRSFC